MVYAIQLLIEVLKTQREAKKLSQRELAAKIGVPQSHISKIESGKVNPRLSSFVEMARLLDLEVVLIPQEKLLMVTSILRSTKNNDAVTPAYLADNGEKDDN